MNLDWRQVWTVARREYLTTVRRKAFLLTLLGTPLYFAFVMGLSVGSTSGEVKKSLSQLKAIGVVDSSGLLANAEHTMHSTWTAEDNPFQRGGAKVAVPVEQSFDAEVHYYPDAASAQAAVRAGEIGQALVIPADYLTGGRARRYVRSASAFSEAADRAVGRWLAANLVRGRVDSALAARVARPLEREATFKLDRDGQFVSKSTNDDLGSVFIPMIFGMALGLTIVIGGQYLVQGVVEEKESRILESLLSTLRPSELMAGKLLGLGSVGLTVIVVWGMAALFLLVPAVAMLHLALPAFILPLAVAYFVGGYLLYGSLMLGIGAVTNNMREAQQLSVWFSFANFAPLILLWKVLTSPNGPAATFLSMFPLTAATGMMMRLAVPGASVPLWQIAISLVLQVGAAWYTLVGATRVFRIGMLMYGKTPNLPEILRWARQG
jgi:ABC-2 type transport system permease protein